MTEVRIVDSLSHVDRAQWAALFPGEVEDYDYLTAVERAGLQGFRWRYVLAFEGAALVGAAPVFLTEYPLETTLAGPGRRVAEALRRRLPNALVLRLACLGSPCTERALVGLSRSALPAVRDGLIRAILAGLETIARDEGCGLLGLKDLAAPDAPPWAAGAAKSGYRPLPSLPIAHLDIDFRDIDQYLARLSPGTRKDMRRKLRAPDRVRIEIRTEVDDLIDQIMALYDETRGRAEMSLEDLTAAYFTGVLRGMPGRGFFVLYYDGDELLAANLLLHDGDTLVDKYFCMDGERGRPLNLYFLSWFTNVRLCLENGWTRYQSGQAAYDAKLRLGSRLTRTANYFRHRNLLVNGALRLVAPMFAADPTLRSAA